MSTAPDQKAMILDLWRELRECRGLDADVYSRIRWNWPSLSDDEVAEVWAAYQRRMDMKKTIELKLQRPSSPSKTPKHHVRCELGHRLYTEVFESTRAARTFIDALLKDEPIKWESNTEITAKGGVLRVECEELEQIMEFDASSGEWRMPENMQQQLRAFLRGHWENKSKDIALSSPPKVVVKPPRAINGVTLGALCEKHKWNPRNVRAALRKAKWDKPSGGWTWPEKEAKTVEKKLEGLMG